MGTLHMFVVSMVCVEWSGMQGMSGLISTSKNVVAMRWVCGRGRTFGQLQLRLLLVD